MDCEKKNRPSMVHKDNVTRLIFYDITYTVFLLKSLFHLEILDTFQTMSFHADKIFFVRRIHQQ